MLAAAFGVAEWSRLQSIAARPIMGARRVGFTASGEDLRILIVDDHALFREGLKLLLAGLGPGADILEAGSAAAGLIHAARHQEIDLVLLDINLPGYRGLDSLRLFRAKFPTSAIVLLSGVDAPALIREALASGAQGFIHKSVTADEMLAAISTVLGGDSCYAVSTDAPINAAMASAGAPSPQLTPRQKQVLLRLCEGMSNKEIGRELAMSDNTVRVHVSGIFRILGVRSRTEAAMLAHRNGLVA